jgi:uncharacterized protein (DUF1778 family)
MARRSALLKKHGLMLRLSDQEREEVRRAAHLETQRRGEIVPEAVLAREILMPAVRQILADAEKVAA